MSRGFRFAVQEHRAGSGREWMERARQLEGWGYSALYLPDHFSDQLGPTSALASAAAVTTTLRLGCLVYDNDYRHPALLAKEMATLDVLSEGRADFGLGAGWMQTDYEQIGMAYDPPKIRIDRMVEGLAICRGMWADGPFYFKGEHYQVTGLEGTPKPVQKPHPPLLLGGGGKRMLRIAAREADIVNINFNLATGHVNNELVMTGTAEATDEKLGWIREAAGDRLEDLELSVTLFLINLTDDPKAVHDMVSGAIGATPEQVREIPHFLVGSLEHMEEDLRSRRERYGITYTIIQGEHAEALAPLVAKLSGT